jgi:hypothetical protein
MRTTGETVIMQIQLGQAPPYFWTGLLILLLAVAASILIRSYATLTAVRGYIKVALAALQTKADRSIPSSRTRVRNRP